MQLGYGWKIAWSAAVVAITLIASIVTWFSGTLPFKIEQLQGRSMAVLAWADS